MRNKLSSLLVCALLATIGFSDTPPAKAKVEMTFDETFGMLVERNIFSRNRSVARKRREQEEKKETPPPERFIVLKGIAREDKKEIAFFENVQTGTISRVSSGSALMKGRIAAVTLNSVEYIINGKHLSITIGQNLEGGTSGGVGEMSEQTGSTAGKTTPSDSQDSDILKRMMERRQKELGK